MNVIWYRSVKKKNKKQKTTTKKKQQQQQSRLIEGVQRRATKLVNECSEMSYGDRLCYLKLHSLQGCRL